MSLKPKDVHEQTFRVSFRGFDPVEVDAFLKRVADEIERLTEEKNNLELDLDVERASRKSLEETLEATSHIQRSVLEKSREEARLIVERANFEAERLRERSLNELAEINRQTVAAKERRAFALSELSALAHGVADWAERFGREFGVEGQAAFDARMTAFGAAPAPAAQPPAAKPAEEPWEELALETTGYQATEAETAASATSMAAASQNAFVFDGRERGEKGASEPEGFVLNDDRSSMLMDIMDKPETYTPPDMRGPDPKKKVKAWESSPIERPEAKPARGPAAYAAVAAAGAKDEDEEAIEIIEDFTGEES